MKDQVLSLINKKIVLFEKTLLDAVQELEKLKVQVKLKPEESNMEGLRKVMLNFPQLPALQGRVLSAKTMITALRELRLEIEALEEDRAEPEKTQERAP